MRGTKRARIQFISKTAYELDFFDEFIPEDSGAVSSRSTRPRQSQQSDMNRSRKKGNEVLHNVFLYMGFPGHISVEKGPSRYT